MTEQKTMGGANAKRLITHAHGQLEHPYTTPENTDTARNETLIMRGMRGKPSNTNG
jgi:hypothetical protein